MEAILVIDKMPNSCEECVVRCDGYTAKEYFEKSIKRPSWCPLRPLPEKKDIDIEVNLVDGDGYEDGYRDGYSRGVDAGWNDCLKEIVDGND